MSQVDYPTFDVEDRAAEIMAELNSARRSVTCQADLKLVAEDVKLCVEALGAEWVEEMLKALRVDWKRYANGEARCRKCGGTGKVPYQLAGGRCFNCQETGWIITPEGHAMRKAFYAQIAAELEADDAFLEFQAAQPEVAPEPEVTPEPEVAPKRKRVRKTAQMQLDELPG